jgi:hypothetical protein
MAAFDGADLRVAVTVDFHNFATLDSLKLPARSSR